MNVTIKRASPLLIDDYPDTDLTTCQSCGALRTDREYSFNCPACNKLLRDNDPKWRAELAKQAVRRNAAKSDIRGDVWMKTGGKCWYCGTQTVPWRTFRVDHVTPVAKGGTNDLTNLVPCCTTCNGIKGNRPVEYLRQRLQRTLFYFESEAL